MKTHKSLLATTVCFGFLGIASALFLSGAPVDLGTASLGNASFENREISFVAVSNTVADDASASLEPGYLALLGIALIGLAVAHRQRKAWCVDGSLSLRLRTHIAALRAKAAALRPCAPVPLFADLQWNKIRAVAFAIFVGIASTVMATLPAKADLIIEFADGAFDDRSCTSLRTGCGNQGAEILSQTAGDFDSTAQALLEKKFADVKSRSFDNDFRLTFGCGAPDFCLMIIPF
jgi:hypothetical protein